MFSATPAALLALAAGLVPLANAHIAFYHPSMWGFNVTAQTFSYDNRPMVPLMNMNFDQWWFHGYKAYPPNPGDIFELPAGGVANAELACDKGLTTWWASSEGGNIGFPTDNPCLGQPISEFHTTGPNDLGGCGMSIAYTSDADTVQPDDFAIFSVNQTCVWSLNTAFEVPAAMPACPDGGCICMWHWIHTPDSGSEQMYLIPFRCSVTGSTGTTPVGKPMLPRRCGADPANGVPAATPGNCTIGPKLPMYWDQTEGDNMFEGIYSPPLYQNLYGFSDGAQTDIFQDAYIASEGAPAPTANVAATTAPTTNAAATTAPAPAPTTTPAAPSSTDVPVPSPSSAAYNTPAPASPVDQAPASSSVAAQSSPPAAAAPNVQAGAGAAQASSAGAAPSPSSSAALSTPTVSLAPSSTQKCRMRPTAGANATAKKRRAAALQHHKRQHIRDVSFR